MEAVLSFFLARYIPPPGSAARAAVDSAGYTAVSVVSAWKKGTAASSLLINRRPKEPGPQLLAMAEEAFCR